MSLLEFLIERYGYNNPILSKEVECENYTRQEVYKQLSELCKYKKIARLERGVYFIPEVTKCGTAIFKPMTAIEKKYVSDGESVFGYFSGRYILYLLGISKIKPATIEIYTNAESQKSHRLKIANQNLLLHKPRTKIDKYNAGVLSFLELMNGIDIEDLDEYKKKLLADYINEHRITKRKITEYIKYFPNKTCRNLIESEVIYNVKL